MTVLSRYFILEDPMHNDDGGFEQDLLTKMLAIKMIMVFWEVTPKIMTG